MPLSIRFAAGFLKVHSDVQQFCSDLWWGASNKAFKRPSPAGRSWLVGTYSFFISFFVT